MNTVLKTTFLVFCVFQSLGLLAQTPYEEGGNTRFRFAQTTIGGDIKFSPMIGNATHINADGELEDFKVGNAAWARFLISGWHFWGHVDFYLGISMFKLSDNTFGTTGKYFYNNGIETGVKVYPSRISDGKIRPYVGFSFNNTVYWQEFDNIKHQNLSRNTVPLQTGVTFVKNKSIFDFGITYNYKNKHDYYISESQTASIGLPKLDLSIGYRTYFDVSVEDEPALLDGTLAALGERMKAEKKANSFSIAVGLSSPFYIRNKYNSENFPFIGDFKFSNSFFDYGLGYYMHKPDIHFNIAFRNYKNRLDAFNASQTYHRTSIGLEVFKFLFDYKGFLPFVGPVVSYDINRMNVINDGLEVVNHKESGVKVGLVFGWDIRQDDVQWAMLRTNLRYYPFYNLEIDGKKSRFDVLEFNIIQFVFYPTRYKWIKENKPKRK